MSLEIHDYLPIYFKNSSDCKTLQNDLKTFSSKFEMLLHPNSTIGPSIEENLGTWELDVDISITKMRIKRTINQDYEGIGMTFADLMGYAINDPNFSVDNQNTKEIHR